MRPWAVWLLALAAPVSAAAAPPRLAIFAFELVNTSPAPSTALELARLHGLDRQLQVLLADHDRFAIVADSVRTAAIARVTTPRTCNGCERDAAHAEGAAYAAYGWVQKVSNLILNVNVVIEDVATGRRVKADSVDIRGNTDESWQRGLRYLINERLYRDDAP